MLIFPAIDIRAGACVRLAQGDFDRQTSYRVTPVEQAQIYAKAGCAWVHMVDLDGARTGRAVNAAPIRDVVGQGLLKVQLGGGIRSLDRARFWLDHGVARIVLGTAALHDPDMVRILARQWPGRIALGIDARRDKVAVEGWEVTSDQSPLDVARRFDDLGLGAVIYTDIGRDGVAKGPDIDGTARLVDMLATPVIASGGVRDRDDVAALAASNPCPAGVIIGRALYEGGITAAAALAAADGHNRDHRSGRRLPGQRRHMPAKPDQEAGKIPTETTGDTDGEESRAKNPVKKPKDPPREKSWAKNPIKKPKDPSGASC